MPRSCVRTHAIKLLLALYISGMRARATKRERLEFRDRVLSKAKVHNPVFFGKQLRRFDRANASLATGHAGSARGVEPVFACVAASAESESGSDEEADVVPCVWRSTAAPVAAYKRDHASLSQQAINALFIGSADELCVDPGFLTSRSTT